MRAGAGKFKEAFRDLESVAKAHPRDVDAQRKFKECEKIVRRQAFERAIAGPDAKQAPVSDEDVESIVVEPDYAGPRLECVDGQMRLTLAFAQQLLDTFKAQKKLHRKFAIYVRLD